MVPISFLGLPKKCRTVYPYPGNGEISTLPEYRVAFATMQDRKPLISSSHDLWFLLPCLSCAAEKIFFFVDATAAASLPLQPCGATGPDYRIQPFRLQNTTLQAARCARFIPSIMRDWYETVIPSIWQDRSKSWQKTTGNIPPGFV